MHYKLSLQSLPHKLLAISSDQWFVAVYDPQQRYAEVLQKLSETLNGQKNLEPKIFSKIISESISISIAHPLIFGLVTSSRTIWLQVAGSIQVELLRAEKMHVLLHKTGAVSGKIDLSDTLQINFPLGERFAVRFLLVDELALWQQARRKLKLKTRIRGIFAKVISKTRNHMRPPFLINQQLLLFFV